MGDNLFKRMNAEGFIRQRLASEGEELFRKPRGFELGMAWLNARPSTERVPFLRGMGAFFARYYPGNRNGYVRLFSGSKLKKPNIGLQL
jgi:hypothetical protein